MKPELRLDFCSYQAANYACRHWHYSRKIPVGKLVKIGVWEDGKFIGVIVFGDGLLGPKSIVYGGVDKFKVAEIVRIALRKHEHPVSRMIAIAVKLLLKRCPGIELIVSFADQGENHHGTRKHRYFLPLTPRMKDLAIKMQKNYPKRATSKENVAPGVHPGEGGVNPTVALHRSSDLGFS